MHNEVRKERYNIKYFVGCEDMLAKYIKETCNMADFSDNEILTALLHYGGFCNNRTPKRCLHI